MTTDREAFQDALVTVPRFVYGNGLRLTMLSVAWVIASLPLVTVGPATLAVYTAVGDLRSDRNRIDRERIARILGQNGIASALFSGVPVVFAGIAVLYGATALSEGSLLGEVVALVAAYVALYVLLALVPTFVALSTGTEPVESFRYGVGWLRDHPTPALTTGLLTVVLLAVSVLLTIAFVLLFAGVAASLHVAVVETVDDRTAASDAPATAASAC